jgi:transcriptional regulator with XRE-family HTH domain
MGRLARKQELGHTPTPEEAFGVIVRRIRLKRGLSQQALADMSGYHRTYIGLLEGGQKSPSLRTVFNIAITLQVRPSEVMRGVEQLAPKHGKKDQQ